VTDGPQGSTNSGPTSGWVKRITQWLGLPSAVVALLGLAGKPASAFASYVSLRLLVTLTALVITSVALTLFVRRQFPSWGQARRQEQRLRQSLAPAIPPSMRRISEHRELITIHIPMLQMTTAELAERAAISPEQAVYVEDHPDFVPSQDIEARIRKALMVPLNWPTEGYGDECTTQRLLWYASKGQYVWMLAGLKTTTPRSRAAALRVLEAAILNGMRRSRV
jgi:hypothetical protein